MRKPVNIIDPGFDDREYAKTVADVKRILEKWSLDVEFQNAYRMNPKRTLADTGLQVDPETIELLIYEEKAETVWQEVKEGSLSLDDLPESYIWYKAFLGEKLKIREKMRVSLCEPTEPRFRIWRKRQMKRLLLELGGASLSMVHPPVIFELSEGCSVGCPFCGVAAKGLKGIFRYTSENAQLWQDTLRRIHNLVGNAAGEGTCYYACEGLDNPDYEKFIKDFYQEFGVVPQTTTAVSTRDIGRTRALLQYGKENYVHVDRFSVLSPEMRDTLFKAFTPEELLLVELLPQFPEAPQCHLTKAGRNRREEEEEFSATIACASGFIINMQEKSVRLQTPIATDRNHPTGEWCLERCTFVTSEDLEDSIRRMVRQYMSEQLDLSGVCRDVCHFSMDRKDSKIWVRGYAVGAALLASDLRQESLEHLLSLLKERSHTGYEIIDALTDTEEMDIAQVILLIKTLWEYGLIDCAVYEKRATSS